MERHLKVPGREPLLIGSLNRLQQRELVHEGDCHKNAIYDWNCLLITEHGYQGKRK